MHFYNNNYFYVNVFMYLCMYVRRFGGEIVEISLPSSDLKSIDSTATISLVSSSHSKGELWGLAVCVYADMFTLLFMFFLCILYVFFNKQILNELYIYYVYESTQACEVFNIQTNASKLV